MYYKENRDLMIQSRYKVQTLVLFRHFSVSRSQVLTPTHGTVG